MRELRRLSWDEPAPEDLLESFVEDVEVEALEQHIETCDLDEDCARPCPMADRDTPE